MKNSGPDTVVESEVEEIEIKKPKKNVVQSLEMSDFENEDTAAPQPVRQKKQTQMISS